MKQTGSNFVTKTGILLLVLLLLAAAFFQVDSLVLLLIALLILSVIAYAWTYFSLSRLDLDAEAPSAEGFPGEDLTLRASLTNRKLLPVIWLRLSAPVRSYAPVRPPEEDGTIRSFLWVMPYQTITWNMTLHAERRGVWAPAPLRIAGGDGFGLAEQERSLSPVRPFEFAVYPALVPVNTAPLRRCIQNPEVVPNGRYEDVTLLRHVRDYQDGDSARQINWRQMARTGELIVNVYEKQEVRHITFALDAEAFLYTRTIEQEGTTRLLRCIYDTEFEAAVSLLASAALDLLEHGLYVTLFLPQGRISAPNERYGRAVLYALAQLDPLAVPGALPDDAVFAGRHQDGPLFLFTRSADARIDGWLERYRAMSPHVICLAEADRTDPAVWSAERIRG